MPAASTHQTSSEKQLQDPARTSTTVAASFVVGPETTVGQQLHTTTGTVRYVKQPASEEVQCSYGQEPPEGADKASNLELEEHDVTVTNIRAVADTFSLERQGFVLEKLEVPEGIDWDNTEEVKLKYYPVVEKLLKKLTGATRTLVYDHQIRRGKLNYQKSPEGERGKPVPTVHTDYTEQAGHNRIEVFMSKDEAEPLRQNPFAILQVWRPLKGPVDESPLALIDATTIDAEDLIPSALQLPNRVARINVVKHNTKHRFYYAKGISEDEVYVFVGHSSRAGFADSVGRVPHTGFVDHGSSKNAPPRESIELRSYIFWENTETVSAAQEL